MNLGLSCIWEGDMLSIMLLMAPVILHMRRLRRVYLEQLPKFLFRFFKVLKVVVVFSFRHLTLRARRWDTLLVILVIWVSVSRIRAHFFLSSDFGSPPFCAFIYLFNSDIIPYLSV